MQLCAVVCSRMQLCAVVCSWCSCMQLCAVFSRPMTDILVILKIINYLFYFDQRLNFLFIIHVFLCVSVRVMIAQLAD